MEHKGSALKSADRDGMMFQPEAGLYVNVDEIDFTSLYPSIIAQYNLSPETIEHPNRTGFLASALKPLVAMRFRIKWMKKSDPQIAGIDSILKWMLVTCFGYTGYKNAKFGRIEVHEAITRLSRDILIQIKEIAKSMGFVVLRGIVDSLWVQGSMLALMAGAYGRGELEDLREEVRQLYLDAVQRLPDADVKDLVINRRISRLTYSHRCLEAAVVEACRRSGIEIAPGVKIGYVVRDARTYAVDTGWDAERFDVLYYRTLLEKAWAEISYAFRCGDSPNAGNTVSEPALHGFSGCGE